jgi:hypothetical protein
LKKKKIQKSYIFILITKHFKKKKEKETLQLPPLLCVEKELETSKSSESWPPASAALRKYSSSSFTISTRSLLFLDTTIASSLVVVVSLENSLTIESGGVVLAALFPVPVAVAIASDVIVVASHSSSVTDLDEDGTNGSQKSHVDVDAIGGGGGGGGGRAGEAVIEVHVSELGLIGGGGGGGAGICGCGEGRSGCKWWCW